MENKKRIQLGISLMQKQIFETVAKQEMGYAITYRTIKRKTKLSLFHIRQEVKYLIELGIIERVGIFNESTGLLCGSGLIANKEKCISLLNKIQTEKIIRDEMDADMEDSGMAQGEIESCLNHWFNKYEIKRK